jgi:predicted amidohydrolase YtcJ
MSTTVIKNGTIVTADLTYKADVMIEGGVITAIGPNLVGRQVARRNRLLCHARRHRSAHPPRNAVHGHLFRR